MCRGRMRSHILPPTAALAILAILAILAYPSYPRQLRKQTRVGDRYVDVGSPASLAWLNGYTPGAEREKCSKSD